MWRGLTVGLLLLFPLLASFALLGACTSKDDEDDEQEEREWRCFEGATDCRCTDVSDGSQVGSSDPEVDACSYTNCYAFGNDYECACEPAPFTPTAEMLNPRPVDSCPFD